MDLRVRMDFCLALEQLVESLGYFEEHSISLYLGSGTADPVPPAEVDAPQMPPCL